MTKVISTELAVIASSTLIVIMILIAVYCWHKDKQRPHFKF